VRNITQGLTMPDITNLKIGYAKRMEAAILFFDLENFTTISSTLSNEDVLYVLNIIIPAMMHITQYWKGEVEKNTGDGIMAIFGTETRNSFTIARDAIEAAMAMRYVMYNDIWPKLINEDLPLMNFRIGIDMGDVLISRIGIHGLNHLTVVGDAANRASKLQGIAQSNGIFIGENLHNNISDKLHNYCNEGEDENCTLHHEGTYEPYKFYHYNFDWTEPKEWFNNYKNILNNL
jgi:class 3 adenylate cyclase